MAAQLAGPHGRADVCGFGSCCVGGAVVGASEIIWGGYRPNLVSRLVWTSVTALGFATAVGDDAGWAALPVGALAAGSLAVTLAAAFVGHVWMVDRLDVVCGVLAAAGLCAWVLSGVAAAATLAAVAAAGLAAVPTFRQALRAPERESWRFYAMSGTAAAIGFGALGRFTVASAGFGAYLVLLCASLVAVIVWPRRSSESTTLR